MDLPITRPSMISYADEIQFPELLKDLSENKHNGFIRITLNSEEGYILFKDGEVVAASYERLSRVDAIEKIKDAMNVNGTLIEIFNVKPKQFDFFMDINKPYLINSAATDLINELKKSTEPEPEPAPEPKAVPKPKPISEAVNKPEIIEKEPEPPKPEEEPKTEPEKPEIEEIKTEPEPVEEVRTEPVPESIPNETTEKPQDKSVTNEKVKEPEPVTEEKVLNTPEPEKVEEKKSEPATATTETKQEVTKTPEPTSKSVKQQSEEVVENSNSSDVNDESLENVEMPPMDRTELLKKYGIKDIQDEDVENLLESYKGGSVSDEDLEKIELTLMNKIKKSILTIPRIKGAEVMVFLDHSDGLSGKVNIMIESESKGILSRFMGESNSNKLEKQIIDIAQIEIRKSFRKYPEIVDKFEVNVEIS